MAKRPRFYCESCGAEVAKDARICPYCGKFFSSVKCPKCGHAGRPDDFSFGCPVCGYAVSANPAPEPMRPAVQAAPPPPWWAFLLVALVLFALVVALLRL